MDESKGLRVTSDVLIRNKHGARVSVNVPGRLLAVTVEARLLVEEEAERRAERLLGEGSKALRVQGTFLV